MFEGGIPVGAVLVVDGKIVGRCVALQAGDCGAPLAEGPRPLQRTQRAPARTCTRCARAPRRLTRGPRPRRSGNNRRVQHGSPILHGASPALNAPPNTPARAFRARRALTRDASPHAPLTALPLCPCS